MKCSPFSRGFRKGGKHMHRHRGRFMKHFMRRRMDEYASSSSSSSDDEWHRNRQIESDSDMQHRMGHHGMNSRIGHHGMNSKLNHDFGMNRGMKDGHGTMEHDHGMIHRMRHGQGMMHGMRHPHSMMHGMKHPHSMMRGMRHGHEMEHWHDKKHGKRHGHFMEHRMKHHHGMKHKMHHGHGHGRKHKMGHGPGMHHKLRKEFKKSCPYNRNEGRTLKVDAGNMNENSGSEAPTFYMPKTSAQIMNENNKFQISLETSYYQPEEVSVKIVDGKIDVSAMHESMEDNIYEFHEMYRSFDIPNNVNPEVITARLDADGKLIIEAACNDQEESSLNERDVPVTQVSE